MDRIHIDTFDSTGHLCGKRRTYENIKAAALEAGRFSTFEATEHPRLFTRLRSDPEVEVFRMPYPWHGIRLREGVRK